MLNSVYDVVIFGGGTSGCACAWNCARLGLKTLLIEKESYLGGTISGALVTPVMKSGENQINTTFYDKLVEQMKNKKAQVTYMGNKGWFNPFIIKDELFDMLEEKGVEILLNASFSTDRVHSPNICGNKILSVCIDKRYTDKLAPQSVYNSERLSVYIGAKYFIDATGNLEFSQNVNCRFLNPDNNDYQPVSLRFIMSGVDLERFGTWLLEIDKDRDVTTVQKIDGETHLSTAYTWDTNKNWALAPFFDDAVEKGVLKDSDRNYFQIFTLAGMPSALTFNCPRILENINPYSQKDLKYAYKLGLEVITRLENFCKLYFVGFENAKVYKIADKLGIRSGKRILGKYIYTIDDLRSGKKFPNTALISNYPVDVHSRGKNTSTLENFGEYSLPIESLMSADYDNLYIAGRGLSADIQAQGALRVQASCFSMGEAVACDIFTKLTSSDCFSA